MTTPLINGIRHSWGSIKVNLLGRTVIGITAIDYDDKQDKKNHYGSGTMPTHRGHGRYEATVKFTLEAYEVDAIQRVLGFGKRLQDIEPFDIIVTFMPKGSDRLITHVIRNCEFLNNKRNMKEGDTNISVELELLPSHIEWY